MFFSELHNYSAAISHISPATNAQIMRILFLQDKH